MFNCCCNLQRQNTIVASQDALPLSLLSNQNAFKMWNHNTDETQLFMHVRRWDTFVYTMHADPLEGGALHLKFAKYMYTSKVSETMKEAWTIQSSKTTTTTTPSAPIAFPTPFTSSLTSMGGDGGFDLSQSQSQPTPSSSIPPKSNVIKAAFPWFTEWMSERLDPNNRFTSQFINELCRQVYVTSPQVDSSSGDDEMEWRFHIWFMSKWGDPHLKNDPAALDCLLKMVQSGLIVLDANRFYEWIIFQRNASEPLAGKEKYRQYRKHKGGYNEWAGIVEESDPTTSSSLTTHNNEQDGNDGWGSVKKGPKTNSSKRVKLSHVKATPNKKHAMDIVDGGV
ncbi:unnamed protein product [Sphagnum jensenii]|uniref:Uncharacterized protein n=1 Tax=Sphagnum jensenii TaxID=128206 RepID=A0ABP0VD92_9BRYO